MWFAVTAADHLHEGVDVHTAFKNAVAGRSSGQPSPSQTIWVARTKRRYRPKMKRDGLSLTIVNDQIWRPVMVHPDSRGPGAEHPVSGNRTPCGRTLEECPGETSFGRIEETTCGSCLKMIAEKERQKNENWRRRTQQRSTGPFRAVTEVRRTTGRHQRTHGRETFVPDIDSANLAARRSEIRKLPLSDRRAAGDAADRAHRAAVNAFAALNGWQATKCGFNCLDLLGRSAMSDSIRARGTRDCELLDHHIWFRGDRRYVAAVGKPYLADVDIAETRARLAPRDLVLHIPPDPLASFHYPGWTLFTVVTRPGVVVRFLPEQDGRLKGLWRDWLNDCSDYRAGAATALLEATR